jgi:hypothetical protein
LSLLHTIKWLPAHLFAPHEWKKPCAVLDDFRRETWPIDLAGHPAIIDAGISPVDPAKSLQRRAERRAEPLPLGIVGATDPDCDLAPLALLRGRGERPCSGRASEQRDEHGVALFDHLVGEGYECRRYR